VAAGDPVERDRLVRHERVVDDDVHEDRLRVRGNRCADEALAALRHPVRADLVLHGHLRERPPRRVRDEALARRPDQRAELLEDADMPVLDGVDRLQGRDQSEERDREEPRERPRREPDSAGVLSKAP
jgi:hypothetical protein